MSRYPAIALIEFSSIAVGIKAGDAMVKKAPITVLKSGTVHNGKFLVFIGGSVASVSESFEEGLWIGADQTLDRVILPDVHEQVHDAALGKRQKFASDAVGIIETTTVASMLSSADSAVKGANVDILEIRLADDLGGKAFSIFSGSLEDVEMAIDLSREAISHPDFWLNHTLIPRLHEQMAQQIDHSTYFAHANLDTVEGGEV